MSSSTLPSLSRKLPLSVLAPFTVTLSVQSGLDWVAAEAAASRMSFNAALIMPCDTQRQRNNGGLPWPLATPGTLHP